MVNEIYKLFQEKTSQDFNRMALLKRHRELDRIDNSGNQALT
jgi:hypothetical protein